MARSAKPVEGKGRRRKPAPSSAAVAARFVVRNPAAFAGTTGLLVAVCYVSANALWYQPHAHRGVFFATRSLPFAAPSEAVIPETTIRIERPEVTTAIADPRVAEVQTVLKDLAFYDGKADGIAGPATAKAIARYRLTVGLPEAGGIDRALLEQLGMATPTSGIPETRPAINSQAKKTANVAIPDPADLSRQIQLGLKAFGNEDIAVDGIVGARTELAIREFQGLFGLPATGRPDRAVYEKMRETGLIE